MKIARPNEDVLKDWTQRAQQEMPNGGLSLKGVLPFRLCTSSYIIPGPILPNLLFVSPYVDEVELVLFQSSEDSNLPSRSEIREMIRLASDKGITYNVHLPTDLYLGDPDSRVRQRSVETVLRFYERTFPLSPTVYVLHLERRSIQGTMMQDLEGWADRVAHSLRGLAEKGLNASVTALENLDYPLGILEPFVAGLGFRYCIDIGHLIKYGLRVVQEIRSSLSRCSAVHLHGVKDGIDHKALDAIGHPMWKEIMELIWGFRGSVSIEVFSWEDLRRSLDRIGAWARVLQSEEPSKRS